jgi:hypothetical protein
MDDVACMAIAVLEHPEASVRELIRQMRITMDELP